MLAELTSAAATRAEDVDGLRDQFPCLSQRIRGKDLVFLDSAASAQKPARVIDALTRAYTHNYANVHRGAYALSAAATDAFEQARGAAARFLNAPDPENIVFTKGATEAANLLAFGLGESLLRPGDEVLTTELEHHANLLPWEQACKRAGATLKLVPVTPDGDLTPENVLALLGPRVKIFAFTAHSNALGTVPETQALIQAAAERGVITVLDASQAAAHAELDAQALGCDFLFFSGHKIYGPCGTGILYGKAERLAALPPYQTGGEMVDLADPLGGSTWQPAPLRFEAGTPAFPEVSALTETFAFLTSLNRQALRAREAELTAFTVKEISALPGYRVIGRPRRRESIVPFVHERAAAADLGEMLDMEGIAVRAGHHCAQPLMRALGLQATARASFGLYSDMRDAEALIRGLRRIDRII